MYRYLIIYIALLLLAALNLVVGSVDLSPSDVLSALLGCSRDDVVRYIVIDSRLPQTLMAVFCGASLSVCGLILQTLFRNPLAGPSVFGIDGGAALGVAVVMLLMGDTYGMVSSGVGGYALLVIAALAGASVVTMLLLAFSSFLRDGVRLLIVGVMLGYLSSSLITILHFHASADGVKAFSLWGMGSFGYARLSDIPFWALSMGVPVLLAMLYSHRLNVLSLGDDYARTVGVSVRLVRSFFLLLTGLLVALTTASCGPVAFIGLSVPHLCRLLLQTSDHRSLLLAIPGLGASTALLCLLLTRIPGDGLMLPLNAVTPLIGVPVIIYLIDKRH